MADFKPIKAFGNQFDFEEAFKRDGKKIFEFLDDVHKNPAKYKVPEAHIPHLKPLYDAIVGLKFPEGTQYLNPTPSIQSLRLNDQVAPTVPIPWIFNDKSKNFFTIFDLLGVFLTLIGPAPKDATQKNYFLPLLVVYAKWCFNLSPGSGFAPNTAQVTWATNNGVTYPFLGANAKGFKVVIAENDPDKKKKKKAEEKWRDLVQKKHFEYLKHMLEPKYQVFGKKDLPKDKDGNQAWWPFGNCAETYPFLYLLDTINPSDPPPKEFSHGISLEVGQAEIKDAYKGSDFWNQVAIKPLCPNCQYLVERYKTPVSNYEPV